MEQEPRAFDGSRILNYEVIDGQRHAMGTVEGVWVDPVSGALEFIGVKTGLVSEKMALIPAVGIDVQNDVRAIQVPFTDAQIAGAPSFGLHHALTGEDRREIERYYQLGEIDQAGLPR